MTSFTPVALVLIAIAMLRATAAAVLLLPIIASTLILLPPFSTPAVVFSAIGAVVTAIPADAPPALRVIPRRWRLSAIVATRRHRATLAAYTLMRARLRGLC